MASSSSAAAKPVAGRRKRPGVDQQRKLIMESAVELFASQGTNATSVSDICKRAGVSRDTYYRCFSDKDTLIGQLYQTSVNKHVVAVLDAADVDFSDPRWVHKVCGQTIDSILEQHKVAQFLFVESADPNSYAYQVIHSAYDKMARRMQKWSQSKYAKAPPREFFKSLLVATQWLVHNAIINGLSDNEVKTAKQAAEQLFFGAFTGIEKYDPAP